MTATPVGMRCPDCSRQRTPVRTMRSIQVEPIATYVVIAINAAIFFGARSSASAANDLFLFGPAVADGDWWRLLTGGFLQLEWWHIGMNMLSLYWLGRMIEPALGHVRYVGVYLASLLVGSLSVMLFSPNTPTLGASGAVYGLLGAAIVMARNRNIDLMQSGLVPILVLNVLLTLVWSNISVAGHFGGLVGGVVVTYVVEEIDRRRRNSTVPAVVFCALIGAAAVAGSVASVS
jgi:membrane associated rhomboid family serine protease